MNIILAGRGYTFCIGGSLGFAEVMRRWTDTGEPLCLRGSAGRAPSLRSTPAFALQMKKNHIKKSVRVAGKCLAERRWQRFVEWI